MISIVIVITAAVLLFLPFFSLSCSWFVTFCVACPSLVYVCIAIQTVVITVMQSYCYKYSTYGEEKKEKTNIMLSLTHNTYRGGGWRDGICTE